MKALAILAAFLGVAFSVFADSTNIYENFAPNFSTNTEIIWDAPANHLPQSFWIYRRLLPRIFSQTVISNAFVLASLQQRGIPKPSTNDYFVPAFYPPPNYPGMIPDIFVIRPGDALLSYGLPNDSDNGSKKEIPNNETVVAEAMSATRRLGLDPAKMIQKSFYTDFNVDYQTQNPTTNGIRGRGVFFSRQLDGVMFFAPDDQGDGAEGFFFELGIRGEIRAFSVHWSDVERFQSKPTASPQEIVQCIRGRKVIILPDPGEEDYFARVKKLGTAKKFIISKITPYYTDSVVGEVPTNNDICQFMTPCAGLDATAEFGDSNMIVHLCSPITSSDVKRLLRK